jgi:hypothetical protein
MRQRVILLTTGSSDPSVGAGTAHFWVEGLSLSNWGDWNYTKDRLESVDLSRVWSVHLRNKRLTDVRIVAQED